MTTTNIDAKAGHGLTLMKWAGLDAGVDRISPATIVSTALADENAFRAGARALAELDSTRAELAAAKSEVERLRSELAEWKRDAIAANKEETRFREQYKAVAERCIHRNCKTPMVVGMDSFGYCEFHSNPTNRG